MSEFMFTLQVFFIIVGIIGLGLLFAWIIIKIMGGP